MSYSNYADIESAVKNRTPFFGNSAKGELVFTEGVGCEYMVWSYGTLVGTYSAKTRWVSERRYSKTTSRLQNILRRVWEV
jgi:hypothetical protein